MTMGFLKILSNVLYCIIVALVVVDSSLDVYKYSKTGKTEEDKKKLKKYLGRGLLELVVLSTVQFL